jgi:Ca2+/H+ antiporter
VSRALSRYAMLIVGLTLVAGVLLSLVFHGPGDRPAVWLSAAVAVAVQLLAFTLSQAAGRISLQARMGTGALIRFLAVVAYALLVGLALELPLVAALISLVTFFFLSTLLEPLLIKT